MDMIKCKHGNFGECDLCGDIENIVIWSKEYVTDVDYEYIRNHQNAQKTDTYPPLSEVLDDWINDLESGDIYVLPKLLEKMKDFKELIES